jgi:hypothetical protein
LRQRDLRGANGRGVRDGAVVRRRGGRVRRSVLGGCPRLPGGTSCRGRQARPLPLWGRDTADLASFLDAGFEATVVCVDPRLLDASACGRRYDELLAELPPSVDPCGENGEFHTFVSAGPIFAEPIVCKRGEIVEREGFLFCDLTAA